MMSPISFGTLQRGGKGMTRARSSRAPHKQWPE